jgi:hypothetical protein
MSICHASGNRFLNRECSSGRELYNQASASLNLKGGTLSVDDSVLDKPYSHYRALLSHFCSGKPHHVVKGINRVTGYYPDVQGKHQPVNFRVVDKAEGKTNNDYFPDLLTEVLAWSLEPALVTADRWYSWVKTLKRIKTHQLGLLLARESNRLVCVEKGTWVPAQQLLDRPEPGGVVWLKNFGFVKLFRTPLKHQVRSYISSLASGEQTAAFDHKAFTEPHDRPWQIEQYQRAIKQICNLERFQVRSKGALTNHLFAALCGFGQLQKLSFSDVINNYSLPQNLFNEVSASFIGTFRPNMMHLNPKFHSVVKA